MLALAGARVSPAAPTAPAGPVMPPEVISSSAPPVKAIDTYLDAAVAKLPSDAPADQQAGRDALVNGIGGAEGAAPSAAFISRYADEANTYLLKIAASPNFRVRLNAAIAAARIADKSDRDQLVPAVKALLQDKTLAVNIWAIHAARSLLSRPSSGSSLMQPIVDAAKRFPDATQGAYEALASITPPTTPQIEAIQNLFEARIALYSNGVPPDAVAENFAMARLVDTSWWNAQSESSKARTAQLIANLGTVVGKRVTGTVTNDQREAASLIVRQVGSSGSAIGITDPDKVSLRTDLQPLQNLPRSATAPQISEAAELVFPAFKKVFPTLTNPPMIATSAPSTPATAPASP